MSRIQLKPKNPEHEVVVGLDRPLSTFFIVVTYKQDEDDLRDLAPIEFRSRWGRGELLEKIEEYAEPDERTKLVQKAIFLDEDPEKHFKAAGVSLGLD